MPTLLQYQDRLSGLHWYGCTPLWKAQWDAPELPLDTTSTDNNNSSSNSERALTVGEAVLYNLPLSAQSPEQLQQQQRRKLSAPVPVLVPAEVTRLRIDDATSELKYDVAYKGGSAKWVQRSLLQRAPRSADELELDAKAAEWKRDLVQANARTARAQVLYTVLMLMY
jgi:hypothetical protein